MGARQHARATRRSNCRGNTPGVHHPGGGGMGGLLSPRAPPDRRGHQSPVSRLKWTAIVPRGIGMLKITGYPDRYSVAPGEKIDFKISLEEGESFDGRIVRVVHGDCNPEGPGLKFPHIPTALDGKHPGRPQRIDAGSYMIVDPAPPLLSGPF